MLPAQWKKAHKAKFGIRHLVEIQKYRKKKEKKSHRGNPENPSRTLLLQREQQEIFTALKYFPLIESEMKRGATPRMRLCPKSSGCCPKAAPRAQRAEQLVLHKGRGGGCRPLLGCRWTSATSFLKAERTGAEEWSNLRAL